MLQFFDWFWKAIGLTQKLGIPENNSFQGFIDYFWKTWMAEGKTSTAILLFIGGIVFLIVGY